jgi:pimeloyl-ACP methyl ester carboxylesterase
MQDGIDEIRAGDPPYPSPGPVPFPGATGFTATMQSAIELNIYGSDPAQVVLAHGMRSGYGKGGDAIDPPALAAQVRIPTLVTCGTKDVNTPCVPGGPVGSGVSALAASFEPGVAQFVTVLDMVHGFRDVGEDDPTELPDTVKYPFSQVFAAAFSAFMGQFVPAAPVPLVAAPRFTG